MTYSTLQGSLILVLLIGCASHSLWSQEKNCYCSISGTITDQDNTLVASDAIIYKLDIQDGRVSPTPACSAKTDAEGHYTCALRSKGQYIVQAHARQQAVAAKGQIHTPESINPITFYPNATNMDTATRLTITDGDRGSGNIMFAEVRPATIHVILPAKPPRASLTIALHGRDYDLPTGIDAAYDAMSGTFTISSVAPETYKIDVNWYADAVDHRGTAIATTRPESVSTINLQESTNSRIDGIVEEDAWPKPRWPSAIVLQPTGNRVQKELTSPISPDGHIAFPVVPDGEYRVTVQGSDDTFVQSLSLNGKPLPNNRIMTFAGENSHLLDIKLSNHAASMEGNVSTASPTGTAGVVIESVSDGDVHTVKTDQRQHFVITDLPPGEYRLYAWPNLQSVEYRNPDYLARYARDSTKVTLGEAEHTTQLEVELLQQDN